MSQKYVKIVCPRCGKMRTPFKDFATGQVVEGKTVGCTAKHENVTLDNHQNCPGFKKGFCHCDLVACLEKPAPTSVVEPKPVSPPPVVQSALPVDPRWSMGPQSHISSSMPLSSMPPSGGFPPMPRPSNGAGVDVVSEILNLTKLVASLEKMLMLQQETINKQNERIQLLEQQREGSDAYIFTVSERVYTLEQAKVESEAAKTVTVQNPKPRNFVKTHVEGKKPNFKGEKKPQEQQTSEGKVEKPHAKKPFKPYPKGKKERKFQGPKPEISQEPFVPDIVVIETSPISPSNERKVVATNLDTEFLAEEIAPGASWGDVVESD